MAVPAGVLAEADADAWLKDALARALEANERWEQFAAELRAENERLRTENATLREELPRRGAELEQVKAALAVLQRMVFGRSSERSRPQPGGGGKAGTGKDGGPARRRGRLPPAVGLERLQSLLCVTSNRRLSVRDVAAVARPGRATMPELTNENSL